MQLAYIHTPETRTLKQGFTIVELLIVVVVIGILAAISLVAYNGVIRNVAIAALQSDLKNASTQLGITRVQTGSYPAGSGSDLSRSEGTTLEYSSDGSTYCLSASSTKYGLISLHLDSTIGTIEDGLCNGHTAPSGGGEQAQGNQGVVTTLAGSGSYGYADGTGAAAQFHSPAGVAIDTSGNLYVADNSNHRIRKVTPSGEVTTFAGSGTPGTTDGTGTAAQFTNPSGVVLDASGNLYVSDNNHRIRKVTPSGEVTTLAGSSVGFADGNGAAAQFNGPGFMAVGANGNLYVADSVNDRIRKVTPSGEVTTLAGSSMGFADGTGAAAQFTRPGGIAIDAAGNLYVADRGNHRIRKVTPEGEVTTLAGSTYGFADGTGAAAQFYNPLGIVFDSAGNLYVADSDNHRIRKVTPGGEVTTLAGSGETGFFGGGYLDGSGTVALFKGPYGIAITPSDSLYVTDVRNQRIRKVE